MTARFVQSQDYQIFLEALKLDSSPYNCEFRLNSLYGSGKSLWFGRIFQDLNRSMTLVTSTTEEAESLYHDLLSLYPQSPIFYFTPWQVLPYENISPFQDLVHHRLEVLHHLLEDRPYILVTPIVNLMKALLPREDFELYSFDITLNKTISYPFLTRSLVQLGYQQVKRVDHPGEYAIKGALIDIFPPLQKMPIRIELLDDQVISMRQFDIVSQSSSAMVNCVRILPQREIILNPDNIALAKTRIQKNYDKQLDVVQSIFDQLDEGIYFQGIEHLLPFFSEERATLLDYLAQDNLFVFFDKNQIRKRADLLMQECSMLYQQRHKHLVKAQPLDVLCDYQQWICQIQKNYSQVDVLLFNEDQFDGRRTFRSPFKSSDSCGTNLILFKEAIQNSMNHWTVIVFSSYEQQLERLKNALSDLNPIIATQLSDNDICQSGLFMDVTELNQGFVIDELKLCVVIDREILGRRPVYRKKLRKVTSNPIENWFDLNLGDLVVHIHHGVGRYMGIQHIQAANLERDCILIEYRDKEKLYVPIEQLSFVQKYIGAQNEKSALDQIGGKVWERTKTKVKKNVEALADSLIQTYFERMKKQGYAFADDNRLQNKFESSFEFQETQGQLEAIEHIKLDMQSTRPTDRLICGDVGFGKTEVAIRAVFKAVQENKQVAFLCPTVILCEQHFRTLSKRFQEYSVRVATLSRLQKPKQQTQVIHELKEGRIDVLIGTHRLLSKQVQFKNLGLVVVDEEHRFGVRHKEKLKMMFSIVDIISMSATPIPRTLHMAMIKIRDISIIDTPPDMRQPVENYVMEWNEDIVTQSIRRELSRGGQVFCIYNHIAKIKEFATYLNGLVPEMKVAVIHGQMEKDDVEHILLSFIRNEYDLLLATTILESGIDIPNVNTMLIYRADQLGLSQLYQLRGRVGRGYRHAYCYLFYPENKVLSEIAQKRLSVINEYTDLGSGLNIALKDMELRGVGNLLGFEQSGSIARVGFELYCKLLEEAVQKILLKQQTQLDNNNDTIVRHVSLNADVYIDLKYSGFIPEGYVPDERQRVEIYKKIANASSNDDILTIESLLKDRFGCLPEVVCQLLHLARFKYKARKLNMISIIENDGQIVLNFSKKTNMDAMRLMSLVQKHSKSLLFYPNEMHKLQIRLDKKICTCFDKKMDKLDYILDELSKVVIKD